MPKNNKGTIAGQFKMMLLSEIHPTYDYVVKFLSKKLTDMLVDMKIGSDADGEPDYAKLQDICWITIVKHRQEVHQLMEV